MASKTQKNKKDQYLPNQKALFAVLARIRLRMIEDQREANPEDGRTYSNPNQPEAGLPCIGLSD